MADLKQIYTGNDSPATVYTSQGTNVPGITRRFLNGKEYLYVKAGGTIAVNQACKFDFANKTDGSQVIVTAAVTDHLAGVNEAGALVSGNFFFMTVRGYAQCQILTAATAGQILAPTATAGVLGSPANTDVTVQRAVAMQAGAATNAVKAIYLL